MKRALILVDIQNDFLPGGALAVPKGDEIVPVANRLQPHFDLVVATQDWHPPHHKSFAQNHPGKSVGEMVELAGLPQMLWPVHCVQNTGGALFAPGLETRTIRQVFSKGEAPEIDSYSGFFDNGQKKATGLHSYLQGQQVEHVTVVGLATDYCVKFTALDAQQLGYKTVLVEDGCRGVGLQPGDIEEALTDLGRAGVQICRSADIP